MSVAYPNPFDKIPPELFAIIVENGIRIYGIRFVRSLCLVCRSWNDWVASMPTRFWGIIKLNKSSKLRTVTKQIAMAESGNSPLEVYVKYASLPAGRVLSKVANISHKWVSAEVPTSALRISLWSGMRDTLEQLALSAAPSDSPYDADSYFDDDDDDDDKTPPKLHSFAAISLSKLWITRFLSTSITHFELSQIHGPQSLSITLEYLTLVPQLQFLRLDTVRHTGKLEPSDDLKTIPLLSLKTLIISNISYFPNIMSRLRVPSLRTFSNPQEPMPLPKTSRPESSWTYIRSPKKFSIFDEPLNVLISQWSQPGFIPTHIHTIELSEYLHGSDIPELIQWLANLPSLVCLTLRGRATWPLRKKSNTLPSKNENETNLYKALATPNAVRGQWLCPSLARLTLDTHISDLDKTHKVGLVGYSASNNTMNALATAGLLEIARARGSKVPGNPPSRLRRIEGNVCSDAYGDIEELEELVDDVFCTCLSCEIDRLTEETVRAFPGPIAIEVLTCPFFRMRSSRLSFPSRIDLVLRHGSFRIGDMTIVNYSNSTIMYIIRIISE